MGFLQETWDPRKADKNEIKKLYVQAGDDGVINRRQSSANTHSVAAAVFWATIVSLVHVAAHIR